MKTILIRKIIGETLREFRISAGMTLREVSVTSMVSLGYLSEIERGQKEASSEVLFAVTRALQVPLSELLARVQAKTELAEAAATQVMLAA